MALNDLEISVAFDRCWEIYRRVNDAKEMSARKAFCLAVRQGTDPAMIEVAVRIYALESQGDEYCYQFGNFIRDDHWQDYIGKHTNYKSYLASLEKKDKDAKALLVAWNEGIPNHWCPVIDIPAKIPLAKRALSDEAFRENWKNALELARKIFYKPLHSTDMRSKVILSFTWFTKLGEKHTVMRIVEREYGSPDRGWEVKDPGYISAENYKKILSDAKKLWDELKDEL
jgi:hypothetical protein